MARKRTRDWPQLVYEFHCEPVGEIPQQVWTVAKRKRELWNKLVEAQERLDAALQEAGEGITKEQKDAFYQAFDADITALTKASGLDWVNGPDVLDRFRAARTRAFRAIKSGSKGGFPRFQGGLKSVRLLHRWTGGGLAVDPDLCADEKLRKGNGLYSATSKRFRMRAVPTEVYHSDDPGVSQRTGTKAVFSIAGAEIPLRVVLHREIPRDAVVKSVALCGKRDVFGWHWTLNLTLEIPPVPRAVPARKCAIDIGWRKMEDYIRVGVLADSDGNVIEFRLPLDVTTNRTRASNKWLRSLGKQEHELFPESYSDLAKMSQRIDMLKDECKASLKEHFEAYEPPEEVKGSVAQLQKMGTGGLVKLMRRLEAAAQNYGWEGLMPIGPAWYILKDWLAENDVWQKRRAALMQRVTRRREDLYGQYAAWIAERYGTVIIEKGLDISEMIEAKDKPHALRYADRYHQWAAPYDLIQKIKQAVRKAQGTVKEKQGAYTTVDCHICGEQAEQTGKLRLTCPNGHEWDQDVNAALNLLSDTGPGASWPADVPERLRRHVVVLSSGGQKTGR